MKLTDARPLFTVAAIFNAAVALPLLLAYPQTAALLHIEGPATVWVHLTAAMVLLFGYAYWCIARDPVRFRPYVPLGVIGKLVFVVCIYGHWLAGDASGRMAALVTVDAVFALLFVNYLRRHPQIASQANR